MVLVTLRMEDRDAEAVKKVSKARGESVSSFIRRSVKRSLVNMGILEVDDIDRKALGLEGPGGS